MSKLEKRGIIIDSPEMRSVQEGTRKIEGYGIVFNSLSRDLGGFREIIKPEAIDGVLEISDVICVANHKHSDLPYARSTNLIGTLSLEIDENGVKYSFEAPNAPYGDDILECVKRCDIRTSSFAFYIAEDGEEWDVMPDGTYLRTITKFEKIIDVSPVTFEAYEDTTVAVRSLEDFKTRSIEDLEKVGELVIELNDEPSEEVNEELLYEDELRFMKFDLLRLKK